MSGGATCALHARRVASGTWHRMDGAALVCSTCPLATLKVERLTTTHPIRILCTLSLCSQFTENGQLKCLILQCVFPLVRRAGTSHVS